MGGLPDVVIQRTRDGKAEFLAVNGWTPHRVGALSFDATGQADLWLASLPKSMRDGASVARVACEIENPGQAARLAEYDPYDGAR